MREGERDYVIRVLNGLSKKPCYPCLRLYQDYLGFLLFVRDKGETHYLLTVYKGPTALPKAIEFYMNIIAWYMELRLNERDIKERSL